MCFLKSSYTALSPVYTHLLAARTGTDPLFRELPCEKDSSQMLTLESQNRKRAFDVAVTTHKSLGVRRTALPLPACSHKGYVPL